MLKKLFDIPKKLFTPPYSLKGIGGGSLSKKLFSSMLWYVKIQALLDSPLFTELKNMRFWPSYEFSKLDGFISSSKQFFGLYCENGQNCTKNYLKVICVFTFIHVFRQPLIVWSQNLVCMLPEMVMKKVVRDFSEIPFFAARLLSLCASFQN